MNRKGQMFVVGAIVIVVALVMMKGLFTQTTNTDYQGNYVTANIESEYQRLAGIDHVNGDNRMGDFALYLRGRMDIDIAYLYSEKSNNTYTVIVGNYLGYNSTFAIGTDRFALDDRATAQRALNTDDINFQYDGKTAAINLNSQAVLFYTLTVDGQTKSGVYRIFS